MLGKLSTIRCDKYLIIIFQVEKADSLSGGGGNNKDEKSAASNHNNIKEENKTKVKLFILIFFLYLI